MKWTTEEVVKNIKDCGQALIEHAESIAGDYKYRLDGLRITCYVNEFDREPSIEVCTEFVPENFVRRLKEE
jgi:hypothetical protein